MRPGGPRRKHERQNANGDSFYNSGLADDCCDYQGVADIWGDMKLNRPLVVFDCESTGADPHKDRIVELAAVKLSTSAEMTDGTHFLVNPGVPIPAEASGVHGIFDKDVISAPLFGSVAHSIREFFEGCDIGGFNIIAFDVPLLEAEFKRAGIDFNFDSVAIVDSYRIMVKMEQRTLSAALEFYCGRVHDSAHAAMGDVVATVDVLRAQVARYNIEGTPDEIERTMRGDAVDRQGKFKLINNRACFSFGKHAGKPLDDVAKFHSDYLRWGLREGVFQGDSKRLVEEAIGG